MILETKNGHKLDHTTWLRIRHAEKLSGVPLVVAQGSYNGGGVAASGGTHDGGGVADFSVRGLTALQVSAAVKALRQSGLIAWFRSPNQGPWAAHIHAVERASQTLSPAAAKQVLAWEKGRNGLASNGRDDGPKVNVPIGVPMNNVQKFRELVAFAITEYGSRVPRRRRIARGMVAAISAALKTGPKS